MNLEFHSVKELYDRMKPALTSKKEELIRCGYQNIDESDIWNYLKETKWKQSVDLTLYTAVDDVLNCDNHAIAAYYKEERLY